MSAKLAGRDSGTDLAVLKFEEEGTLATPQFADYLNLKAGKLRAGAWPYTFRKPCGQRWNYRGAGRRMAQLARRPY